MSTVCGLDLHRDQLTFDVLDTCTAEVWRGRVWQPDRQRFRRWLADELGPRARGEGVAVAVEGCTGWRYVLEEVAAAGFEAHLAEPAETQAQRGSQAPRQDGPHRRPAAARRGLPKFLDDASFAAFMRAARNEPRRPLRLVIELLGRTGMRVGELGELEADAMVKFGDAHWLRILVGKLQDDRYIQSHP